FSCCRSIGWASCWLLCRPCRLCSDRATADRGLLAGDALDQPVEGLGEEPDAVELELPSDRLQVDAQLAERPPDAARLVDAGVDRARDLAVLAERRQRLRRHGVDGVRSDQLLDVHHVAIGGVLGAGARPERPLHLRPLALQRAEAAAAEELLEAPGGDPGRGAP